MFEELESVEGDGKTGQAGGQAAQNGHAAAADLPPIDVNEIRKELDGETKMAPRAVTKNAGIKNIEGKNIAGENTRDENTEAAPLSPEKEELLGLAEGFLQSYRNMIRKGTDDPILDALIARVLRHKHNDKSHKEIIIGMIFIEAQRRFTQVSARDLTAEEQERRNSVEGAIVEKITLFLDQPQERLIMLLGEKQETETPLREDTKKDAETLPNDLQKTAQDLANYAASLYRVTEKEYRDLLIKFPSLAKPPHAPALMKIFLKSLPDNLEMILPPETSPEAGFLRRLLFWGRKEAFTKDQWGYFSKTMRAMINEIAAEHHKTRIDDAIKNRYLHPSLWTPVCSRYDYPENYTYRDLVKERWEKTWAHLPHDVAMPLPFFQERAKGPGRWNVAEILGRRPAFDVRFSNQMASEFQEELGRIDIERRISMAVTTVAQYIRTYQALGVQADAAKAQKLSQLSFGVMALTESILKHFESSRRGQLQLNAQSLSFDAQYYKTYYSDAGGRTTWREQDSHQQRLHILGSAKILARILASNNLAWNRSRVENLRNDLSFVAELFREEGWDDLLLGEADKKIIKIMREQDPRFMTTEERAVFDKRCQEEKAAQEEEAARRAQEKEEQKRKKEEEKRRHEEGVKAAAARLAEETRKQKELEDAERARTARQDAAKEEKEITNMQANVSREKAFWEGMAKAAQTSAASNIWDCHYDHLLMGHLYQKLYHGEGAQLPLSKKNRAEVIRHYFGGRGTLPATAQKLIDNMLDSNHDGNEAAFLVEQADKLKEKVESGDNPYLAVYTVSLILAANGYDEAGRLLARDHMGQIETKKAFERRMKDKPGHKYGGYYGRTSQFDADFMEALLGIAHSFLARTPQDDPVGWYRWNKQRLEKRYEAAIGSAERVKPENRATAFLHRLQGMIRTRKRT